MKIVIVDCGDGVIFYFAILSLGSLDLLANCKLLQLGRFSKVLMYNDIFWHFYTAWLDFIHRVQSHVLAIVNGDGEDDACQCGLLAPLFTRVYVCVKHTCDCVHHVGRGREAAKRDGRRLREGKRDTSQTEMTDMLSRVYILDGCQLQLIILVCLLGI